MALLAVATLLALLTPAASAASAATDPPLRAGQRLVDTAGALGPAQGDDVRSRLEGLAAAGTDPVVVVREREATAGQALEQVEAVQQAWVAATGADQDVALAVLVDLAPPGGTPRVGVYAGRDLREGALPEEVLGDVVADARGPVRDGDVHRGLVVALDRLEAAVRAGPPEPSRADRFAERAAATWLPWTLLAVAAAGLASALRTFAGRPRVERTWPPPTRQRPDALPAAVGGALALGVVAAVAAVAGAVGLLLGAVAGSGVSVGAALALAAVAVTAAVLAHRYPRLSRSGLEAARGWRAYREGLRLAADMDAIPLDLDAVLPDALAMNLGLALRPRLEEAEGAGTPPRALAAASTSAVVVPWVAFSGTFFAGPGGGAYGAGAGGGVVTGGGAGGGGGAAG